MDGRGEGYAPQSQWYSLPPSLALGNRRHELSSSQHAIHAMENQVSQLCSNNILRNSFYQNSLPQNPSFKNPATTQSHQHDLYYLMARNNLNTNPGFGSVHCDQSTPRQYCQVFGNTAHSVGLSGSDVNVDLESSMGRLSIGPAVRGQTGTYRRHMDTQFSVNEDLYDLSLSQFNSNGNLNGVRDLVPRTRGYATSGSNFSNLLQLESQFSARPSSSHNSVRLDLGSRRSTNSSSSNISSPSWYNNDVLRPRQRSIYSSVEELRGRVCSVAKDQHECRFLQKKVDERNPMDIELILLEVKDELHELMVHQFANYLIQKLIAVLNEDQITLVIRSVVSSEQRLFRICDDVHGTRVMQRLLDPNEIPPRSSLTPVQKSLLVSALKKIAVHLSKSIHGHHVIQRCFHKFSNEYTKEIVEEIAENCLDLARDKSGCCVLQQCIVHAKEEQKGRIIADIVTNALILSEHSYGNYVVQYILGMKIPQVTTDILTQLAGNYFTLSQGKCGSNVVEKCMKESRKEQCIGIINEIIHHPDILDLMMHPYGNYVFQSAWKISEGQPIRQTLQQLVQMNFSFLQSHMYGKKVLAAIRGNKNRT